MCLTMKAAKRYSNCRRLVARRGKRVIIVRLTAGSLATAFPVERARVVDYLLSLPMHAKSRTDRRSSIAFLVSAPRKGGKLDRNGRSGDCREQGCKQVGRSHACTCARGGVKDG